MPTESAFLLAGLLFLAAALGYVFARAGEPENDDLEQQLNTDYLRGLNHLLNDESDRAVEVFTRMSAVDEDTIETHFALGSLFRRRGEVDRAIRVHQNLMARPTLSKRHKDQAHMSLAEDYLSAGLFDRAEDLYRQLKANPEYRGAALQRLLRIYEITHEWDSAISVAEELSDSGADTGSTGRAAHYYCELAEQARAAKDYAQAREMLRQAGAQKPGTVRSTLIRADLAQDTGDYDRALQLYRKVARQAAGLLVEIVPRFAAACRLAERPGELTKFLGDARRRDEQALAAIAMATIVDAAIDDPEAERALLDFMRRDATLAELVDAAALDEQDAIGRGQRIAGIREAVRQVVAADSRYRCRDCGYASLALQWQCPGCRLWETMRAETHLRLTAVA